MTFFAWIVLITHHFKLDRIIDAYDTFSRGRDRRLESDHRSVSGAWAPEEEPRRLEVSHETDT
jgi:hypothetical protein